MLLLAHAIDRAAMAEAVFGGPASHVPIPEDDPRWQWVRDHVIVYPFDARRAQQLLESAGLRRGDDGALRTTDQSPVHIVVQTSSYPRELAIIGDSFGGLGIRAELVVPPPAAGGRDPRANALFPGLSLAGINLSSSALLGRFHGAGCPTEQTRWTGSNRGCYQSRDMDHTLDALQVAIDPQQRRRLWGDFARIYTEELPILPLYFTPTVAVFRQGVLGVKGSTKPHTGTTWNAGEWDVTVGT